MVKQNAPELLRAELSSPKWKPQILVMSGVTDCYQPVERKLKLTRRCLAVLLEFRNPIAIITKNSLVTRDIDVLSELAKYNCTSVCLSVTTLDKDLRNVMEPRTSPPLSASERDSQIVGSRNSRERERRTNYSRPDRPRNARDFESCARSRS